MRHLWNTTWPRLAMLGILAGGLGMECGTKTDEDDDTTDTTDDSTTSDDTETDITDFEFSSRSADCADYVGTFVSSITDDGTGSTLEGSVAITSTDDACTIVHNAIPNHDIDSSTFATTPSAQTGLTHTIDRNPDNPTDSDDPSDLNMGQAQVVMLNGVEQDILAAACYGVGNEPLGQEKIGCGQDQIDNPWRYDPMSPLNNFGTDDHNAHTQPSGEYHYHADPKAMYNQDCVADEEASPVIGFAADGFPLFGPCFDDDGTIRKATSSYVLRTDNGGVRADVTGYDTPTVTGSVDSLNYDGQFRGDWEYSEGAGDLDECNGMVVDGQYGYYITDTFPWSVNCYFGTPDSSF